MSNFSFLSDYFKTVCICTLTFNRLRQWCEHHIFRGGELNKTGRSEVWVCYVSKRRRRRAAFCVFYYFHTRGYKLMIQPYSMLTLRATKYSKSLASLCFSGNATKQNQDVLRVKKLCSYFHFYPLYNMWKDQLHTISGSEFYEWLFGLVKFSGLLRNARLEREATILKSQLIFCVGAKGAQNALALRVHRVNAKATLQEQSS